MKLTALLSLAFVAALPTLCPADVYVAGEIDSQTWTLQNSPYFLTDSVIVPVDASLIIEPGVSVVGGADSSKIVVRGSLNAIGTDTSRIQFQSGGDGWRGILVESGATATIGYARISGAQQYAEVSIHYPMIYGNDAGLKVTGVGSVITLTNSVIDSNAAGGLDIADGAVAEISDCEIRANSSDLNGGGVAVRGESTLSLSSSVVADNVSFSRGGGIHIQLGADAKLTQCLITGNTASQRGAGAYVLAAHVNLTNCTIASNYLSSLDSRGNGTGGLFFLSSPSSGPVAVDVVNAVIYGNDGFQIDNSVNDGTWGVSYTRVEYSIVAGGWSGQGVLDTDPLFVDTSGGDFTLAVGSPGLDAGSPYILDVDNSPSDIGYTGGIIPNPDIPHIETNATRVLIGNKNLGTSVVVRNTGGADLTIDELEMPVEFTTTLLFPQTIAAGDSLEIPISYSGVTGGTFEVKLANSDNHRPYLSLIVEVVAPTAVRQPMPVALTRLYQNSPNPFNPSTTIAVNLAEDGDVVLTLYDVSGRLVRTLNSGTLRAGRHEFRWDGRDARGRNLASGVFLYRLKTREVTQTRSMLLIR
jgi:hypothetical protein